MKPDQKPQKLKRVAIIGAASLALAGTLIFFLVPRQPSYNGKSLSYWLVQINQAGNITNTVEASQAIRNMGKATLPFLFKEIEGATPLQRKVWDFLGNQRFFKLRIHRPNLSMAARFALQQLGTEAASLIPEFTHSENDEVQRSAPFILMFMGPSAIPTLESFCATTDEFARNIALIALARSLSPVSSNPEWYWNGELRGYRVKTDREVVRTILLNVTNRNEAVRNACVGWLKANRRIPEVVQILSSMSGAEREAIREAGVK